MATIKNAVDLSTQAETDIADNTTQEISAEDERSLFLNIIASTLNIKDGGLVIQAQAGYNSAITPSSNYAFSTKKYVDDSISGIDLSALWNKSGNALSARGIFGSLAGSAYGWDFKVNNSVYGGVGNDGKWFWGTNAAFTDTYFSIKSSSNLGTFNALAIKDSDNTTIFEFKSTGNIKTAGGFLNASDNVICNFYASNLYRENSGPKVVVDWANTLLKDNDAVDRINWHFGWLLSGVTVDLDWGNHRLEGSWRAIENFAIGQTPSYGGGAGVMFIANAGTIPSTDPVDGFILYVDPADDKLKARGPGGLVTVLANPV